MVLCLMAGTLEPSLNTIFLHSVPLNITQIIFTLQDIAKYPISNDTKVS